MRLDQFCSEGHRPHALLLTYSIDPLFFETVCWRALTVGAADRIVVLADATQLAVALAAKPRLRLVGRRWILAAADVGGAFHPKFIARFGSEDAAVALLSGNLTSGVGTEPRVGWCVEGRSCASGWRRMAS